MKIKQEIITMLQLLPQPAFLVLDGVIRYTNAAASVYLIQENTPIAELIGDEMEDYSAFSGGTLYLALQVSNIRVGACVTVLGGCQLFTLEQPTEQAQYQALALAAQKLRTPLGTLLIAAEQYHGTDSSQMQAAAQLNRSLYQIQRIVSNMSDAEHFSHPDSLHLEYWEIGSVLEEILEKAAAYLEKSGIRLRWELPREKVDVMLDREKTERAILNLLANAIKFSYADSEVLVQLKKRNERLSLSITSESVPPNEDIYHRFQRMPTIENPKYGIGLGMVLVRCVAISHGGTVLTDRPDDQHSRVTLTLPVRQNRNAAVRSPILRIDYAGERDHVLLELSDVLPTELYIPGN